MTIYWLGKRLNQLPEYTGPELDLTAFQSLVAGQVSHCNMSVEACTVLNIVNSI